MRKNYALLKRYALALTFLFAATLVVHSCKKDKNSGFSDPEIESLKFLYNSLQPNHSSTNLLASLNPRWETIRETKRNDTLVYEVDFDNPEGIFVSRNDINPEQGKEWFSKNLFRLLFIKDSKNHVTKGYYMSIISDNKTDLHESGLNM